jgi:hypothetical protein
VSSGEGGGRSLADLKNDWNRIKKVVNDQDKKMTAGLLNSCHVVALEEGVLRVSTHDFAYSKLQSSADDRAIIDAAVAEVLGEGIVVRYEVTGKRGSGRRSDDIPQDGLVATALDLGGEIVD